MSTDDIYEHGYFGVLSDISLKDFIQLICMREMSKTLHVSLRDETGLIVISRGQIIHAAQGQLRGREAFTRILSWRRGTFRDINLTTLPAANIAVDYRILLLEAEGPSGDRPIGSSATPGRKMQAPPPAVPSMARFASPLRWFRALAWLR